MRQNTKYKKYETPSGQCWNVQGFEPFALDELFKKYKENEITIDRQDVPRIKYLEDGKNRYYFPDIYIPSENLIIEVKSSWTYKLHPKKIILKREATIAAGYKYEMWIYSPNGKRLDEADVVKKLGLDAPLTDSIKDVDDDIDEDFQIGVPYDSN